MVNIAQLFPINWQACFDTRYMRIGAGYDVATTANKMSNPNSIVLCQPIGDIFYMRLALLFKTRDPKVIFEIFRYMISNLPRGMQIGKVCIDASSERFFASLVRDMLSQWGVSVELVDSGASTMYLGEKVNFKSFLGNQLVNDFAEGRIAMPDETWAKDNARQVYRVRGTFEADVDANGNHADFFDAMKLARYSVSTSLAPAQADAISTGFLFNQKTKRPEFDERFSRYNNSSQLTI